MEKQSKFEFQLQPKHTTLCFFILIEIMYGFTFTPLDFTGIPHDILLYSALFFAAVSLVLREWDMKLLIKAGVMLLLGALVYVLAHETLFLIMMLAALLAGDAGYHKVFKTIFFVRLPMLAVILLGTLAGIFPVGLVMVTKGSYGAEVAYGLGYMHPNCLGQEIYFLCSLYICFRNKKINKIELAGVLVIDAIAYLVTKSKTACMLTALLVLFAFFYEPLKKLFDKYWETLAKILVVISAAFPVISIGGAYVYPRISGTIHHLLYRLNAILNGRLSNGSILFLRFPLKLFGMQVDLSSLSKYYSYFIVDNGYVFALFNFGIIPFTALILLYLYALYRLIQKRQYFYAVNLFLFLMCVVSENVMRAMFVNFSVILCHEMYARETLLENLVQLIMGGKNGRKKNPLLLVWRK